ncbi:MAG: hypothetical protein HY879_15465 [Deltaproteobacteria bacterium]|nr:hypothetical protein [Deltaproteobacteria bacterium]
MGKPIILTFTEEEIQTIERIDLDADQKEALHFIRENKGATMRIPKSISTITLILFLMICGSVSYAQDMKVISPAPAFPLQETISDQNKTPNRDKIQTSTSAPPENIPANPESLTPPSVKIQESTNAEG